MRLASLGAVFGTFFMCLPTLIAKHLSGSSVHPDLYKQSLNLALDGIIESNSSSNSSSNTVAANSNTNHNQNHTHHNPRICKKMANRCFLRSLGILHRMESYGPASLSHTDEAMWRSLLITAGRIGGPRMAEISVALFSKMKGAGLYPNAVTYGLYTQALATKGGGGGGGLMKKSSIPMNMNVGRLSRGDSLASEFGEKEKGGTVILDNNDEFLELENDGANWKIANCGRAKAGSATNSSSPTPTTTTTTSPSPTLSDSNINNESSSNKGGSAPPSPISRASSFSTSSVEGGYNSNSDAASRSGRKSPFTSCVGMWLSYACPSCGKMLLEEEVFASMKSNDDSNKDRNRKGRVDMESSDIVVECPRCGDKAEGGVQYVVYQPVEQEEGHNHSKSLTAKGCVSGVSGTVHFEGKGELAT